MTKSDFEYREPYPGYRQGIIRTGSGHGYLFPQLYGAFHEKEWAITTRWSSPKREPDLQATKILGRLTQKAEEVSDQEGLDKEGGETPEGTNTQVQDTIDDFLSDSGGSESKEGPSGEFLYQGSSDDIFKSMMDHFDQDKKRSLLS